MNQKDTLTSEAVCPFLGLRYDRETRYGFPNEGNHCHRERSPRSINLDYQEGVCLTAGYQNCPIYVHSGGAVPAGGARTTTKVIPRERANNTGKGRSNDHAPHPDGTAWTMLDEVDQRPVARAGGGLFSYGWFRLFFGLLLVIGSVSGMLLLMQGTDFNGPGSGAGFTSPTPAGGVIPVLPTETPTQTLLATPTPSPSLPPTGTAPPTATPSPTPSVTQTATLTETPSPTSTSTSPPFIPPTNTPLPTWTPTRTVTPLPTFTPIPPSSTPVPPTSTPSNTSIPPTDTPISDLPTPTP